MIDYQDQAKQFLLDCNATMEIKFVGKEIPAHWKVETKPHNKYQFTITIPKGKYTSYFWDSLHNTEASEMTYWIDVDNESVCDDCFSNNYGTCEYCGEHFQFKDLEDHNGNLLCPSCLEDAIEKESETDIDEAV